MIKALVFICEFVELPEVTACNDSVDLSPNNPFMETQHRDTPLDVALQTLQVHYVYIEIFIYYVNVILILCLYI